MGFITLGILSKFNISLWSRVFAQAAQNLVVLSREDAGAEQIFRNDGVKLIQRLLQSKQEQVVLSALRTLVGLCTGHQSRVSVAVLCEVVPSEHFWYRHKISVVFKQDTHLFRL